MSEVVIGIDVGGTNTVANLVDMSGSVLLERRLPTCGFDRAEDLVFNLMNTVNEGIDAQNEHFSVLGVGIGAPNGNHFTGMVDEAPNLPWKGLIDLSGMFERSSGLPVALTNDANAAALGEWEFGAAKGMSDFIVITIGTGLGSGIVTGGRLLEGHRGVAGEAGHIVAVCDGRPCSCGKRGCLEAYVSARGLLQTARELGFESSAEHLDPLELQEAALKGDPLALAAYAHTGQTLGRSLADLVTLFDPEAIIVHGGIAHVGAPLMGPARDRMEADLLPVYRDKKVKLLPSGLNGRNAGALGAAALIWKHLRNGNGKPAKI